MGSVYFHDHDSRWEVQGMWSPKGEGTETEWGRVTRTRKQESGQLGSSGSCWRGSQSLGTKQVQEL